MCSRTLWFEFWGWKDPETARSRADGLNYRMLKGAGAAGAEGRLPKEADSVMTAKGEVEEVRLFGMPEAA